MIMDILKASESIKTPCYITDENLLIKNLEILRDIELRTGCKILLAQKAFSQFSLYKLISEYISGTTASGFYEARLGYEEMSCFQKENHVFSPAYNEEEFPELMKICDHIVFNSFSQWEKFKPLAEKNKTVSFGLRINPEISTQNHAVYDPCSPFSRLGVTKTNFKPELLQGLEGFHFHTLCEQDADALEKTLDVFLDKFGEYIKGLKWLNFGGGHHITRSDYDREQLCRCIDKVQRLYCVQVYLEPGEAVALNAGFLVAGVLEIVDNGMKTAILDASAACHMPDVLEMPYKPNVIGAVEKGGNMYRLAGNTCLAGDIIGDYCFEKELREGDKLIFKDMAIYSMVKNNTFNGMPLPSIAVLKQNGEIRILKKFGYSDFKNRLS